MDTSSDSDEDSEEDSSDARENPSKPLSVPQPQAVKPVPAVDADTSSSSSSDEDAAANSKLDVSKVKAIQEAVPAHVKLIAHLQNFSFYDIHREIIIMPPLQSAERARAPVNSDGKNAFDAILANPQLGKEDKSRVMLALLSKLDYDFYGILLNDPVLSLFLGNPKSLLELYEILICQKRIELGVDLEQRIWDILIKSGGNNAQTILRLLIDNRPDDKGCLLGFIECWLNDINAVNGVKAVFDKIESMLTRAELKYLADIRGLAQMRVDTIKLAQTGNGRDSSAVKKFMRGPHFLFFSCVSSATPAGVYRLIPEDRNAARHAYEEADTALRNRIDKKLAKEPTPQTRYVHK